ncbi:glycosyltransferase family 9 protein [Archangium violaceum]|uniref:glycosyltransferase family 9 protein n=1 Tax=Archangium violaceum TaxID=83451 RepID=UPI0036D843D0
MLLELCVDVLHQTGPIPLGATPKDLGLTESALRNRVLSCSGSHALPVAMAVVACAYLVLGLDSCMLHVADFFHVPAVGVFGPPDPAH